MKAISSTIIVLFFFSSITAYSQNKKEEKEQLMYSLYIAHKQLVKSKQFEFMASTAYLQKGGQIDLSSRPNYLRINGNNASADIPYFGRATNVGYGSGDTGVVFDGEMIDYQVKEVDKKEKLIVSFKVRNKTETYNCSLTISGTNYGSLVVSSSDKESIRYAGGVGPLQKQP